MVSSTALWCGCGGGNGFIPLCGVAVVVVVMVSSTPCGVAVAVVMVSSTALWCCVGGNGFIHPLWCGCGGGNGFFNLCGAVVLVMVSSTPRGVAVWW